MTEFFNRSSGKENRRELRSNMPRCELILWSKLRGRQILNTKFRRQHGVSPYIVDFYCQEYKFAIELDGDTHFTPEAIEYDKRRDAYLRSLGIEVMRFINDDIDLNLEGVLDVIAWREAGKSKLDGGANGPPSIPPFKGGK